jgi:protein involved in polysaccharide export with SLBB domain
VILRNWAVLGLLGLLWLTSAAALSQCPGAQPPGGDDASAGLLAPGDEVRLELAGWPERSTTTYIAARVTLAGAVPVNGLSPAQAAHQVELTLQDSPLSAAQRCI